LRRNLDLDWCSREGQLAPGGDLLEKVEQALQADAVLVLLSPDSTPARWVRERWESVLVRQPHEYGTRVALALLADCRFPPLLRHQTFFDLASDRLAAFRRIKQWLLQVRPLPNPISFAPPPPDPRPGREAELEELRRLLSDQPGVVSLTATDQSALAAEFARRFADDCAPRAQRAEEGPMCVTA
jgi:3',5'-cyclic AMP phosphodiesterase CpdA